MTRSEASIDRARSRSRSSITRRNSSATRSAAGAPAAVVPMPALVADDCIFLRSVTGGGPHGSGPPTPSGRSVAEVGAREHRRVCFHVVTAGDEHLARVGAVGGHAGAHVRLAALLEAVVAVGHLEVVTRQDGGHDGFRVGRAGTLDPLTDQVDGAPAPGVVHL